MNILFLGSFIPDRYAENFNTLSAAANQFQYNLYSVLKRNHKIKAMSFLAADDLDRILNYEEQCKNEKIEIYLPKVRGYLRELKAFRKQLKKNLEGSDLVITYNVTYPWLNIPGNVRKNVIIADYTPLSEEKIHKLLYGYCICRAFRNFDKAIILSKNCERYLRPAQERVVINGCLDWENFKNIQLCKIDRKIVFVYSGWLSTVTGVDMLLEAFQMTDNLDFKLVICGQGDEMKDKINKAIDKDKRIEYKGFLSKNEYYEVLKNSHILINPRNMNMKQNMNNFPSKILEYIATGRHIISTRFFGYETYIGYIIFVDSRPEALRDALIKTAIDTRIDQISTYRKNRAFAASLDWNNMVEKFL